MLLKDVVSSVAMVLTILQFLSGSDICRKVIKQGHTGTISGMPFVCGVFSTGMWLTYSYLLRDTAMLVTNAVGITSQVVYLALFTVYCVAPGSRMVLRRQLAVLVVVCSTLGYYVVFSGMNPVTIKFHIGLLCCIGSIFFCAAPLVSLSEVIRTQSTASLPFPLILTMLLVTLLWGFYGYLIQDTFVLVPNALCAAIAAMQMSLFFVYPSTPADDSPMKGD